MSECALVSLRESDLPTLETWFQDAELRDRLGGMLPLRRSTQMHGITVLVAAMLLGGPLSAQGFVDHFDKATLDARWQWRTPVEGPTYSLAANPGHLRVTVPRRRTGYNHWQAPPWEAPLLLCEVPEDDFTFEGRVTLVDFGGLADSGNFHLALIAASSPRHVVAWGPFYARQLWKMPAPQVWLERTGQGREVVAEGNAGDVWLRVEKSAGIYTFSVKRSATAQWQVQGTRHVLFEPKFVGFMGKTFGDGPGVTVDLDYLSFETRPPDSAPLEANLHVDASQLLTPLDRNLYGHFIEHLGRCIYNGGIWAEKLRNRKFVGNAGPDGALERWRRLGAEDGVEIARDNVTFYTGVQSQRITSRGAQGEHGIAQDDIELRPLTYVGRVTLRQTGSDASVKVGLRRGDEVLAERALTDVDANWRTFTFELPVAAGGRATFALTTEATAGTLWIGCASLMPADNVDGMRADLLEAIRDLKPPVIRWPGGNFASGYHWQDGLGDRDVRPARFDRAWNAWETNDFGTHEFLRFCELVGCEPYVCLNAGEGTADEAAAWVEYCNGPARSQWGRKRAANGSTEPFGVEYWGLGNELYGPWQLGHLSPTNYARKAVELAAAVRAVDPGVRVIGVGVDGGGWQGWNALVARNAGRAMDSLSAHLYQDVHPQGDPHVNYRLALTAPERFERVLIETARIVSEHAPRGKSIPLTIDEWNVVNRDAWNRELRPEQKLREGLFTARMFHVFLRLADRVHMANMALLVNQMGVIQTDQTRLALTPPYWVYKMYVENTGQRLASVRVEAKRMAADPVLDVVATVAADKRSLFVAAVNWHPDRPIRTTIDLTAFEAAGTVRVVQLTGPHVYAANALGQQPEVVSHQSELTLAEATRFVFPPRSVTILAFAG